MIPAEKIYTNVFMNWDNNGAFCREQFGDNRLVPYFTTEGENVTLYFVKVNEADMAMLSAQEFNSFYRVVENPRNRDISHNGFQFPVLGPC